MQLIGDAGVVELLRGRELNHQGQQQALGLDRIPGAGRQHLFEQNPFVGHVLIDDPQAVARGRDDEAVVDLAQRTKVLQRLQAVRRGQHRVGEQRAVRVGNGQFEGAGRVREIESR